MALPPAKKNFIVPKMKPAAAPAYNEATGEYVASECEKETAYAAP